MYTLYNTSLIIGLILLSLLKPLFEEHRPPLRYTYRLWHEVYAKANGFFWIKCHCCGDEFGGHEAIESVPKYEGLGFDIQDYDSSVCLLCARAVVELREFYLIEKPTIYQVQEMRFPNWVEKAYPKIKVPDD